MNTLLRCTFTLVWVLLLLLVTGCKAGNPLVGRWRTAPPASLLYEYREDGSVRLLAEEREYLVFQYQLKEDGSLRLYDGMGRMQTFGYEVSKEQMTFFDPNDPTVVRETFHREEQRPGP